VSRTTQTGFILDALEQALLRRKLVWENGLVHHSDRDFPSRTATLGCATVGGEKKSLTQVADLIARLAATTRRGLTPLNSQAQGWERVKLDAMLLTSSGEIWVFHWPLWPPSRLPLKRRALSSSTRMAMGQASD
jgi:hypothetical protein